MKRFLIALIALTIGAQVAAQPFESGVEYPRGGEKHITTTNKFGYTGDVDTGTDPEDIWDGWTTYNWPTVGQTLYIYGAASADSIGGTGALTVTIQGLDSLWAAQEVTIPMVGIDTVSTALKFARVLRSFVATAGTGDVNAGNITIKGGVDSTVVATILADKGQTLMAIYSTAAGEAAYITSYYAGLFRSSATPGTAVAAADIELWQRSNADGATDSWRILHKISISRDGTSTYSHPFYPYVRVAPKSDIRLRVSEVTADNTKVAGGFDMIRVASVDPTVGSGVSSPPTISP